MTDPRPYISSGYEVSTWQLHQIYNGTDPLVPGVSNFVVPSVGDYIVDHIEDMVIKYRVTRVSDLISEWERVYEDNSDDGIQDLTVQDLSATAMVLVRNSVSPIIAAVHIGLPIESDIFVAYGKLFLGTDISNPNSIVSRTLDNDGVVVDDRIVINQDMLNNKTYRAEQFHLDRIMEDKTRGTLVFYGVDDIPIAKYTIIFRETDSLINYSKTELFITDLILESVMVNPVNDKEILVEKGFIGTTFNPRVFKVFNTNQREEISLTSRSLRLEGWGNFIFGEENDTFPLSVQYNLASNEKSDMVSNETGEVITANYTIRIVDNINSINYKLYPILTWDDKEDIYSLRFFIYDSTYATKIDVTDVIQLSSEFKPAEYSNKQIFNFTVNLKDAGITAIDEQLSGSFAIQLISDPMDAITPYQIFFVPTDEERYYGDQLRTRITYDTGNIILSIDSDYTQYAEWLDNVYHKLLPIYDSNLYNQAPEPTFVDVTIDGATKTIDILNQWNTGIRWDEEIPVGKHTAELEWYSIGGDASRNHLAYSTMQVEVV